MPSIEEILAEVDKWFAEEVQRPPVSYSVETYNQMHAATQNLRNRLTQVITGKPLDPPAPPPADAAASGTEPTKAPAEGSSVSKSSTKAS